MPELGKWLVWVGLFLTLVGLLFWMVPGLRLGRLPGDLSFEIGNTRVYLPLGTCLLLSVILTLIGYVIGWLRNV